METQTSVKQRVAMMNGAKPTLTEYVNGLEDALHGLIVWAGSKGGFDGQAWDRAINALHAADQVRPVK